MERADVLGPRSGSQHRRRGTLAVLALSPKSGVSSRCSLLLWPRGEEGAANVSSGLRERGPCVSL